MNLHRDLDNRQLVEEVYRKVFKVPEASDFYIDDFFINSSFEDSLIVFFQLTNDDFSEVRKSFYVDFSGTNVVVRHNEFDWEKEKSFDSAENSIRKLRVKVRQDSFNWVIKNNLPFEDLLIGFQCLIDRNPDIYNVKFWNYFTFRS